MTLEEMLALKEELTARKEELFRLADESNDKSEKRKFRFQALLVNEDIISLGDNIALERQRRAAETATARREAKAREREAAAAAIQECRGTMEEDEFRELLETLRAKKLYTGPASSTLPAMAESYRHEADVIRHRIQIVSEIRARTNEEIIAKEDRLRILASMLRDVRDIAVICENYYKPGYHRNERYTI